MVLTESPIPDALLSYIFIDGTPEEFDCELVDLYSGQLKTLRLLLNTSTPESHHEPVTRVVWKGSLNI